MTPAGTVTILHSFGGLNNDEPRWIVSGVIQGTDGALYGTSMNGRDSRGTIFRITLEGTMTVLHQFSGDDGSQLNTALVQAADGNFYGVATGNSLEETARFGTIFRMAPDGTFTVLHRFDGGLGGMHPRGALIQGSDGHLYGATGGGGAGGHGILFRLTLAGSFSLLHVFTGGADGAGPNNLMKAADGVFYGSTGAGAPGGAGAIYRVTAAGELTSLHVFRAPNDGSIPAGPLIQASNGHFYGTAYGGGDQDHGTVFRMTTDGTTTLLHRFTGASGGNAPVSGVIEANDGNFYGTTDDTVFRMSPDGVLTILHRFDDFHFTEMYPSRLIQASDGNFYGTTMWGGTNRFGMVFRLTPGGTLTELHSFSDGADGGIPHAGVVQAADGNFYGTTIRGGSSGLGTVFRMTPQGTVTTLHAFTGAPGGAQPLGLFQSADGNFYGTTQQGGSAGVGTVYRMTPSGVVTVLHEFSGGTDGATPYSPLIQTPDGNLHGSTVAGGAFGRGTLFRMAPSGALLTLHNFTGTDGQWPYSALLPAADGYLYGTAPFGGPDSGGGVIFRMLNVPCTSTVSLTYSAGTLRMGFTLMSSTPATWNTWLVLPGAVLNLWSVPIPAITPAISFPVPIPGVPPLGAVAVVTSLSTEAYGTICLDWQTVVTGSGARNHVRDRQQKLILKPSKDNRPLPMARRAARD